MKCTAALIAVSCSLLAVINAMSVPCPLVDCGAPSAGPECRNVSELYLAGNSCPPCRICLDAQISRQNLACPDYPYWFHTESARPACSEDAQCADGEKCCMWSRIKRCLTAIDMTPKAGFCPASLPAERGTPNCIADSGGCQYDSECSGRQKCCENAVCGYKECKEVSAPAPPPPRPVECGNRSCGPVAGPNCQNLRIVRPNGEGCAPECLECADPPTTTTTVPTPNRQNMACPTSPFWFPTDRQEPICNRDGDCGPTEKCCNWSGTNYCLTGIDMTPKPGSCPSRPLPPPGAGRSNCRADYAGCSFDSECSGDGKCCRNDECGYSQCETPALPQRCTRIGCGLAPGPECQTFEFIRPNGPGCEPECRVCADNTTMNTTTTIIDTTTATLPTTTHVSRENLACPAYPYWFHTESARPACSEDAQCADGEKCCMWSRTKHCLTAIDMTPKAGTCPSSPLPPPGSERASCRLDYVGCTHDSECSGDLKCCRNSNCGYSECESPLSLAQFAPCTEIGCGPAPGPECQNIEFVRPNGPNCEPECMVCADLPSTTTGKPIFCEMTWELICPEGTVDSPRFARGRRSFMNFYRPLCTYQRKKVCY